MHNIPVELTELKNDIIRVMSDYIEADGDEDFESFYTKEDIEKCDAILIKYMTDVLTPALHGNAEKIMVAVEGTVKALNSLNEDCDYCLIETDQREGICELIINTAAQAGLAAEKYDITEEWRDW